MRRTHVRFHVILMDSLRRHAQGVGANVAELNAAELNVRDLQGRARFEILHVMVVVGRGPLIGGSVALGVRIG